MKLQKHPVGLVLMSGLLMGTASCRDKGVPEPAPVPVVVSEVTVTTRAIPEV